MLSLLITLALCQTPPAQDAPSRPPSSQDENPFKNPALGTGVHADDLPAPGRIPEGTSPQARALWRKLTTGDGEPGVKPSPIHAFRLAFEVQVRQPGKFNEIQASIQFLQDPEGPFIEAHFQREARRSVRGPQGDYLIEKDHVQPMRGLDFEQDRQALDQWCSLGTQFLLLSQPERLRLWSLTQRTLTPEPQAPLAADLFPITFVDRTPLMLRDPRHAQQARSLEWLELTTPDISLYRSAATQGKHIVQRALIGIDPQSGEVRMAQLSEDIDGAIVLETALLVFVETYRELGPGRRVPSKLEVREVDPRTSPWSFAHRSGTTLYLKKGGALNPVDISPKTFIPESSGR